MEKYNDKYIAELELRRNKKQGRPKSLLHGVGDNDAPFVTCTKVKGVRSDHPSYSAWSHMICRCYCEKHLERKPRYRAKSVCDEWLSFMGFLSWWKSNHIIGFQLDKDILSDKGIYSPETCIYVPSWINNFTEASNATRGKYAIGVHYQPSRGKFSAEVRSKDGRIKLGRFEKELDAHNAWLNAKLGLALKYKPDMDRIDPRIYIGCVRIIKQLSMESLNNEL